jgi:glutaconate CoA-transferase subunit A
LPFLPTRAGLGSDVLKINPHLKTVKSPYDDGEELVAVPALRLDVAFIHMNRADASGNGQVLGRDPYFDNLFCMSANRAYMSCEKIVSTDELVRGGPLQSLLINRMMANGVVEAPGGAHFTECPPDYARDEKFQREYAATAKGDVEWKTFREKYLEISEGEYQKAVAS